MSSFSQADLDLVRRGGMPVLLRLERGDVWRRIAGIRRSHAARAAQAAQPLRQEQERLRSLGPDAGRRRAAGAAELGRPQVLQRLRSARGPQGNDGERRLACPSARSSRRARFGSSSRTTRPIPTAARSAISSSSRTASIICSGSGNTRRSRGHLQQRDRNGAHIRGPRAGRLRRPGPRAAHPLHRHARRARSAVPELHPGRHEQASRTRGSRSPPRRSKKAYRARFRSRLVLILPRSEHDGKGPITFQARRAYRHHAA